MIYRLDERTPETPADGDWFVAADASVIGSVILHAGASVWFQAVARGDNEPIVIGERSNVQDASVLHTDPDYPLTIGRDVTVGHKAMLHGCTIGDSTLVGINSVILNGAVIGRHCVIGAGALIPEGKEIPDGSLVIGAPGRVKREVTEEEIRMIEYSARHYVDNARRFARGLIPVSQ